MTLPDDEHVSVVIPTHRRTALLERALTSVAEQSKLPMEVLVVDDAGDSDTRALVERRAESFPAPLRYLHNDGTGGACSSRNLGAQRSRGSILAFLDDDDEWHPDFLGACANALTTATSDFALSYVERCYPDGTSKRLVTPTGLTAQTVLLHRVAMTGSSFVIRRASFERVSGFDVAVPVFNDWDLFIRLVRAGMSYAVVPRPLARWIEHEGVRITTSTLRRADGIDRFLKTYGDGMHVSIRAYFLRVAFGIRKSHERSRVRRALLTLRMFRAAGIGGAASLALQNVTQRILPKP